MTRFYRKNLASLWNLLDTRFSESPAYSANCTYYFLLNTKNICNIQRTNIF